MEPENDSFDVLLTSPEKVLFDGKAQSMILPGEQGVFEILTNHKPLMSRIFRGEIVIDGGTLLPIQRGIVRVLLNQVTVIVEPRASEH